MQQNFPLEGVVVKFDLSALCQYGDVHKNALVPLDIITMHIRKKKASQPEG